MIKKCSITPGYMNAVKNVWLNFLNTSFKVEEQKVMRQTFAYDRSLLLRRKIEKVFYLLVKIKMKNDFSF